MNQTYNILIFLLDEPLTPTFKACRRPQDPMLKSPLMQSTPARACALILLSSLLQVLCFPVNGPTPAWRTCLCWVALVPFLLALLLPFAGNLLSIRAAGLLGYLCGTFWYLGNCGWIYQTMYLYGGLPRPISFAILILFSLYLGLYHALFAALLVTVRQSRFGAAGALSAAPFLWVAVELARARITGFPWDLLGNAQVGNLLLTRLAPWAGVMSLSFVVVAVNAAIACMWLHPGRNKWVTGVLGIAAALLLQAGARLTPSSSSKNAQSILTKNSATAVLMQENLEVGILHQMAQPRSAAQELDLFSYDSLHPQRLPITDAAQSRNLAQIKHPDLIVWPEAPSQLQSSDPAFRSAMASLARHAGAPLVIGSLGVDFSPVPPRGYYLYDSASLFQLDGSYAGRYDKIHLVPWGEYIPFKDFFFFARKLTEGVGDMDRGVQRTIFTSQEHNYGVFVCYESIFGDEVRQFALRGAEVLVNISDDGWYGDTGAPWQHLNMARMRAIENHRWLLRSTNTGVTTAIDPEGRLTAEAPRHVRGAFAVPFAFEHETTFYTRHGDWFAYLCTLATLLCVGFSFQPKRTIIKA